MAGKLNRSGRIGERGRPGNLRRQAARGVATPAGEVQAVCAFDPDTFAEIRALAVRAKISFRAQVRLLVEFGLEDIKLAAEPAE
jgi:hypothetical protein